MPRGKIDLKAFNAEILSNKELIVYMEKQAEKVLLQNKIELQNDFDNHVVTREIEAGPQSSNSSGTLGGIGNLFSFIGFNNGSNPVQPVRELLKNIRLGKLSKIKDDGTFTFNVNIPSKQEFESVSKMPWESGRSWLYDIERSISGLGQYLYGKYNKSRSGSGTQSETSVRSAGFRSVPYFATMLEKFIKKLQ
jgi:hypothetical protein